MSKKVYVCCPGGAVTGGPELLHQLVDALRTYNVDAYILYTPVENKFEITKAYEHYNVPIAQYQTIELSNSVVILPEVSTGLASLFDGAQIAIWWLSIDNYFGYTGEKPFREYFIHNIRTFLGRKVALRNLKKFTHFVQSEYAKSYLEGIGINSEMLTDYLNETHLNQNFELGKTNRENIVAYNPKKGVKSTKYLIDNNQDIKFIPIQGMTPIQVRELLSKTKVYMDFGNHPGKDRFPREAAMAGCCIITGMRGSAKNNIDVAIPPKYKINDLNRSELDAEFKKTINEVFENFECCSSEFDNYRYQIKLEPALFKKQVKKMVDILHL